MTIILLLVSILPVILIGWFIYSKDTNKEPKELLKKLFLYGILSTVVALVIELALNGFISSISGVSEPTTTFTGLKLFLYVLFAVGAVEELSKWYFVYRIGYNHDEFDEYYDVIVYGAFVALGFACLENVLYVIQGGIQTGILRMFTAVPLHASCGVFQGYYLSQAKNCEVNRNNKEKPFLILSIIIPIILHTVYDYVAFSTGNSWFMLLILGLLVLGIYIFTLKNIKRNSKHNKKFKFRNRFCPNCGSPVNSDYCPYCGYQNE